MIDEEDLSIARIDILYFPSSLWHKRAARFSPDICEVLSSTILMPYEIPNATRGNKTQKNTPAAYYYDEHGYAAACAFVRVEGCNEVFILGKHDGTWQIEKEADRLFISRMKDSPV